MMVSPTFQTTSSTQVFKLINNDDMLVRFQGQTSEPTQPGQSDTLFTSRISRNGRSFRIRRNRTRRNLMRRNRIQRNRITLNPEKPVYKSGQTIIPDMLFTRNREQIFDKVSQSVSTVHSFLTNPKRRVSKSRKRPTSDRTSKRVQADETMWNLQSEPFCYHQRVFG